MERMWRDQRERLKDKVRGAEADRVLTADYNGGKLVFFQPDFSLALHSGKSLAAVHACLTVDWSDYLAAIDAILAEDMDAFLGNTFVPGVKALLGNREGIFVDTLGAGGCQLRGSPMALLQLATELRQSMARWFAEQEATVTGGTPAASMCIALGGDWRRAKGGKDRQGFMFNRALTQASRALAHDEGLHRFLKARDEQARLRPVGGVRILNVDAGGKKLPLLYNGGLAITAVAREGLIKELQGRDRLRIYHVPREEATAVLGGFRLPAGSLEVLAIAHPTDADEAPILILRIGQAMLAGELVTLHEVLDPASTFSRQLHDAGLSRRPAEKA